ncbi:MAG: YdcF family protein [bacterium]
MKDKTDLELAKILWNYNKLEQQVEKSDCILVLCSNDIRVATKASELYLEKYAPKILFSGGYGEGTKDIFPKPEAEVFADIAIKLGVSKEDILIENKSTNTGENIKFSKELLGNSGLDIKSIILVQKPIMLRRSYATFMKQWAGMKFCVACEDISFEDYPNEIISMELLINTLVGYTQRLKVYSERGFQIYVEIPDEVWSAYEELVKRGYDKHLVEK